MQIILRLAAAISAFGILSTAISAQDYEKRIMEDSGFAASIYHPYMAPEGAVTTPAPKGFKPFYISHYGRHGSRHQADKNISRGYDIMKAAEAADILTPKGKELMADFEILNEDHDGQLGHLSLRGAREHREIAARMYARYPGVFRDKARRKVFCQSSIFPRCIMSMTNFTTSLKECRPSLDFEFVTGERYMDILCHDFYRSKEIFRSDDMMYDSLVRALINPERILKSLFIDDPVRVGKVITDTTKFIKGLYTGSAICECLDYLGLNLFDKYFTKEEIVAMFVAYNDRIYGNYGNSAEFGPRVLWSARFLLEDFIDRAEAAIADGSGMAADLRFGHDTGVMPLGLLIGVEELGGVVPRNRAHLTFNTTVLMPMGSNIQWIFYRNKKGEVLVKFLYNEKETRLTGIPSFDGPYYRWSDIKPYFESLCRDKSAPAI